ncbi:MAG: hypothetical protein ACLGGX_04485 [Bdellovibrionia bacterium]
MKKVAYWASVLMLAFVVGCADDKSSSNNNTGTATTPLDACIQQGTCNSSLYNNYTNYGWVAHPYTGYYQYPNSYQHQVGYYNYYGASPYYNYCSCPSGFQAVYSAHIGLGCLRDNYYQAYSAYSIFTPYVQIQAGFNLGTGTPMNNHWVNIPRISNMEGYANNSCLFTNTATACYVGAQNTCASGSQCIPTAAGSPIGLCIRN